MAELSFSADAITNVPTFGELLWPTLKALRAMGGSASNDELLAKVIELENTSEDAAFFIHYKVLMGDSAMRIALALSASLLLGSEAGAACSCLCMDGRVEALCDSAFDIEPICSPQICPLAAPAIRPIPAPMIPPIGASRCQPEQVYNQFTGQYEWETVCY